MRRTVRLRESELKHMISESVKRVLREGIEFQSDDPVEEWFYYQNKLQQEFDELRILILNKVPKNDPDRMLIKRYISMLQNHLRNLERQF